LGREERSNVPKIPGERPTLGETSYTLAQHSFGVKLHADLIVS
jgi:hypothetical protein